MGKRGRLDPSLSDPKPLTLGTNSWPPCIDLEDECMYESDGRCLFWLESIYHLDYIEPCLQRARRALRGWNSTRRSSRERC